MKQNYKKYGTVGSVNTGSFNFLIKYDMFIFQATYLPYFLCLYISFSHFNSNSVRFRALAYDTLLVDPTIDKYFVLT